MKPMLMRSYALLIALLVTLTHARADTILFVDDDAPPGGDGLTWETAYDDLQDAFDAAEEMAKAVEIRIAGGIYLPTRRSELHDPNSVTFKLLDEMTLLGGFAGLSGEVPDARDVVLYETTLGDEVLPHACCREHLEPGCDNERCADEVCSFVPECCEIEWDEVCAELADFLCPELCVNISGPVDHVMTASDLTQPATIDGLAFRKLEPDPPQGDDLDPGGAVRVVNSELRIRQCTFDRMDLSAVGILDGNVEFIDCLFVENGWIDRGSAVYVESGASFFMNCSFIANRAGHGGAVYLEQSSGEFRQCVFRNNDGDLGGAIADNQSYLDILDCEFTENEAIQGGALAGNSSQWMIVNSCFEHNSTSSSAGAIFVEECDVWFDGCRLANNSSLLDGGAVQCLFSNSTFQQCVFSANFTGHENQNQIEGTGGGLHVWGGGASIFESTFELNQAVGWGGGCAYLGAEIELVDCDFIANQAMIQGGGAMYASDSTGIIRDCRPLRNKARWGGAFVFYRASPSVSDCWFAGNETYAYGGGAVVCWNDAEPSFFDCVFAGNKAIVLHGGALASWAPDGQPSLINCTFFGNSSNALGGGLFIGPDGNGFGENASAIVHNCIFWDNSDQEGELESSQIFIDPSSPDFTADIDYSCIENLTGALGGVGNIDDDPLFVDPFGADGAPGTEDDDLRLSAGSPCIDAAFNNAVPDDVLDLDGDGDFAEFLPFDLDGEPRFADDARTDDSGCGAPAIVDMGAYEFPGIPIQPIRGDITGDLLVDGADLVELLGSWGECPAEDDDESACCAGDLNADGVVDGTDLILLLGNWG